MQRIIVAAILELLFYTATNFKFHFRRNGYISRVKKTVNVTTKKNSV